MFFDWITRRTEQAVFAGLSNAAAKIDSGDAPDAFAGLQARLAIAAAKPESESPAEETAATRGRSKARA